MEILHRHRRHLLVAEAPTPLVPSNFDLNVVIILASLLCALICALGLNSIVRCALLCSHRVVSHGAPEETAAAARAVVVTRSGLGRSVLGRIPVVVYGDDAGVKVKATECAICLGEFADGEKLRVLPKCSHGFHVRCIDTWLESHSSCPTCRVSLAESGGGAAVAAAVAGVGAVAGGAMELAEVAVSVGDADGG